MSVRVLVRSALLGIGLATVAAASTAAQEASLNRVEELTRLGRTEEARATLVAWWDSGRDDASRRDLQRGLWLRGRLTVDPVQAELDFQRLVVLYPRGPYTPRAIFRLAQSAHAMGDGEAAARHVATLVRDYPAAPEREEAEAWLERAGPAAASGARAASAGDPPDRDRAADTAAARAAAGEPPATDPVEEAAQPPAASAAEGAYLVQLGAFAEEDRATALYEEVRAAGIDVRLVRVEGSRFLHVRFGRFVDRAQAAAALEELAEAGIGAALVRDERPEQPVGN